MSLFPLSNHGVSAASVDLFAFSAVLLVCFILFPPIIGSYAAKGLFLNLNEGLPPPPLERRGHESGFAPDKDSPLFTSQFRRSIIGLPYVHPLRLPPPHDTLSPPFPVISEPVKVAELVC